MLHCRCSCYPPVFTAQWSLKQIHINSEVMNKSVLSTVKWWHILYTVSQKQRHPFYFCKNLAKYYPISIIFGSGIPKEICNKSMHLHPPHLFTVLIPYLVFYCPLTCVCIVLKSGPFTLCNKFARCQPNLIVFSRHMSKEFCNENLILTSLSPPNLPLHVATVTCKASNNLRVCQSRSAC